MYEDGIGTVIYDSSISVCNVSGGVNCSIHQKNIDINSNKFNSKYDFK